MLFSINFNAFLSIVSNYSMNSTIEPIRAAQIARMKLEMAYFINIIQWNCILLILHPLKIWSVMLQIQ